MHFGGKDGGDWFRQDCLTPVGQRPHDVPFTDDPVDRGAVARHDDRADPVLSEHVEEVPHIGVGRDRDHLSTLDA